MIKANGHPALTVLAGLFLMFAGAAQAAPTAVAPGSASESDSATKQADEAKPSRHRRHASQRHSSKTADKSSDDKADKKDASKGVATADAKDTAKDTAKADNNAPASSRMPPEVANANAQLATTDAAPAAAASAMTNRASDNVQAAADNSAPSSAENQVVAPDQLNDVDRALQQDNQPAQKPEVAATSAQPRPAPVMASASQQSSAWDQSSLIGKIFIGFGALLTLASAARMFMA